MFKKLALVMACAISAAMFFTGCSEESSSGGSSSSSSSSSSSKINQSSIKGVAKTLINAIINKDNDTLWAILSPTLKEKAIKESNSQAEAKKTVCKLFFNSISDKNIAELKKVMSEDEEGTIDGFITGCGGEDSFEKIDGKWYFKGKQ